MSLAGSGVFCGTAACASGVGGSAGCPASSADASTSSPDAGASATALKASRVVERRTRLPGDKLSEFIAYAPYAADHAGAHQQKGSPMFHTRADLSREMLEVLNGILESKLERATAMTQKKRTAPPIDCGFRVAPRSTNGGEALKLVE